MVAALSCRPRARLGTRAAPPPPAPRPCLSPSLPSPAASPLATLLAAPLSFSAPRQRGSLAVCGAGFGKKPKGPTVDTSVHPLADLVDYRPTLWLNRNRSTSSGALMKMPVQYEDLESAQELWGRMEPLIAHLFPEVPGGVVEGPMKRLYNIENGLSGLGITGMVLMKQDSELPICGSVKARGGVFEVLEHAEKLALAAGVLQPGDGRDKLATDAAARALFAEHKLLVASTGNLGLSVGIMGAALGFNVEVHEDAKEWKKALLREKGVGVVEHKGPYSQAVTAGRKAAKSLGEKAHFVDDESSKSLFLGYSTAAFAILNQLNTLGAPLDEEHPLVVHFPCGVGGAPAGVAWGLRQVLGPHVHVLLAEPTHAPCALLGMASGLGAGVAVTDVGIDGKTEADGLAVQRVSELAHEVLSVLAAGAYTVDDGDMLQVLAQLLDLELTFIEPSCAAALMGPAALAARALGAAPDTISKEEAEWGRELAGRLLRKGTHVFWATGGGLVPDDVRQEYADRGLAVLQQRQAAAAA